METEVGVPLEYVQKVDFNDKLIEREKDQPHTTPIENIIQEEPQFQQNYPQMYPPQEMYYPYFNEPKPDFFNSLDKTTYIMAFIAFILGYFMGKTVQPVIIRPG